MLCLQNTIMNWARRLVFLLCMYAFLKPALLFLWKLLALELNNMKVKWSGPNWLILFSFFHQMTHNTTIWSDKKQYSSSLSKFLLVTIGVKKNILHVGLRSSPASDFIFLCLIWKQYIFNPEMLFVHGSSILQRDSFCKQISLQKQAKS